LKINKNLEKQ